MSKFWCAPLRVLSLLVALHQIIGSQAFAQNKARPTAAEAFMLNSTIQQNRTREELRETKNELKAIREEFGVESPSPSRPVLSQPQAITIAVLGWIFFGVVTAWLLAQSGKADAYRQAGDAKGFQFALRLRKMFVLLLIQLPLLIGLAWLWDGYAVPIDPASDKPRELNPTALFGIPSWYWCYGTIAFIGWSWIHWYRSTTDDAVSRLIAKR